MCTDIAYLWYSRHCRHYPSILVHLFPSSPLPSPSPGATCLNHCNSLIPGLSISIPAPEFHSSYDDSVMTPATSAVSFCIFPPCSLQSSLVDLLLGTDLYPTSGPLNLLFLLTWIYSIYLFSCLSLIIQVLVNCQPLLSTVKVTSFHPGILLHTQDYFFYYILSPYEIILFIYVLTYLLSVCPRRTFFFFTVTSLVLTRD